MNTPDNVNQAVGSNEVGDRPVDASSPDLVPSAQSILERLAAIGSVQPVSALVEAEAHRAELTGPLLAALERGLTNQQESFEQDGVLFNYAAYLLAKWREPRAYPLFIRWFSLPGEGAFDLGGDTVTQTGSRLLASVCGSDVEPIKRLILNREANDYCRGAGLEALGVVTGWGQRLREEFDQDLLFLAREGLERKMSFVWGALVVLCEQVEALAVFPELRRAFGEGLIDPALAKVEELDEVERAPRGKLFKDFADRHPPITDIVEETRWWSGYQDESVTSGAADAKEEKVVGQPGATYVAPPSVGRNDPCPCGSGKKFKKCCGA